MIRGRKATVPAEGGEAELPKGEDVNTIDRLTSIPGLGVFICAACALFGFKQTQGGHNDA